MVAVIARIPVQSGKRDEALEAIRALMEEVKKEEGTLFYTVNADPNNPDVLVFMERYTDMKALGRHGKTAHFGDFMVKAGEFAAGQPEITVMEELGSIDG